MNAPQGAWRLTLCAMLAEDIEQLELLQQLGCDHVQGYYFEHPQPAEQLASQ